MFRLGANMKGGLSKAYDLHADMAKQLINIATALVAAVIAFAKSGTSTIELSLWPIVGLIVLLASIALGVLHLGALAAEAENESSIRSSGPILWMARLQQITFGFSILVLVIAFITAPDLSKNKKTSETNVTSSIDSVSEKPSTLFL